LRKECSSLLSKVSIDSWEDEAVRMREGGRKGGKEKEEVIEKRRTIVEGETPVKN